MPNYDGLYQVKIHYTSTPAGLQPMQHVQSFDVMLDSPPDVGTAWADIDAITKGGVVQSLATYFDTVYLPLLRPLFPTTTEFQYAQLDHIPEGTFAATTISNHVIGVVGTGVGAAVPAQQGIFSFKSLGGGVAFLHVMETMNTSVVRDPYPLSGGSYGAYATHLTGNNSIVVARDNTYLNVVIAHSPGQNEAIFKKRYRL